MPGSSGAQKWEKVREVEFTPGPGFPKTPAEQAVASHIGNIAMKLQRKLRWNPDTEAFVDDAEADRMLARPLAVALHS